MSLNSLSSSLFSASNTGFSTQSKMNTITDSSDKLELQDLQTLRNRLIAIAKEAGTIILSANPTPFTTTSKKNSPSPHHPSSPSTKPSLTHKTNLLPQPPTSSPKRTKQSNPSSAQTSPPTTLPSPSSAKRPTIPARPSPTTQPSSSTLSTAHQTSSMAFQKSPSPSPSSWTKFLQWASYTIPFAMSSGPPSKATAHITPHKPVAATSSTPPLPTTMTSLALRIQSSSPPNPPS